MGAYHAKLSPSKADAVIHCPASMAYLSNYPQLNGGTSVYALEGTTAHFLLEYSLSKKKIGYYPEEHKNKYIKHNTQDFTFDIVYKLPVGLPEHYYVQEINSDILYGVETALNYVYDILRDNNLDFEDVAIEQRVYPLLENEDTSGTADIIICDGFETLWVIDYKHGRGVDVEVEDNYQALAYTLGGRNANFTNFNNYYNVIIQPFLGGIKEVKIKTKELESFETLYKKSTQKVKKYMQLIEKNDIISLERIKSGMEVGKQCRFCPLLAYCPKAKEKIEELLEIDMSRPPEEILFKEANIEKTLPWIDFINNYLRKVTFEATERVKQGHVIEGYELKSGTASRHFVEIEQDELEEILIQEFNLPKDELYSEPKLLSVKGIEDKLPKTLKTKFNEELVFKTYGSPKLVKSKKKQIDLSDWE